jgi:hypothetical protein
MLQQRSTNKKWSTTVWGYIVAKPTGKIENFEIFNLV